MADPMQNAEEPTGDSATTAIDEATRGSSAMLSALVFISRITGFMRTWAQALAIGVTPLASCYAVANNLPSQLYELVIGGMLVTAFLPVYMSLKQEKGPEAAKAYASNLTGIVTVGMGIVTVIAIALAAQVVWTQSFSATDEFDQVTATWLFRFFAIEMVLYSLSSVFSGVLNAERDYAWSGAAPIANNIVTIASFFLYSFLINRNPSLAMVSLALGNPLGVLVQVLIQVPPLARHQLLGKPRIDLRDPALKDTLAIGVPSLVTMVCSFVTVSVQTSCALMATASGASVAAYARLWYTLPYAIFVVPITTTMFTELSDLYAGGDRRKWGNGVSFGMGRILFVSTPLAMLLAVFSHRLVALIGPDFSASDSAMTASYLSVLATSLPLYGVSMYLQKVCSSARRMGTFAIANVVAAIVQVAVCMILTPVFGLDVVAWSTLAYMVVVTAWTLIALRDTPGSLEIASAGKAWLRGCACGIVGAAVGWLILDRVLGGWLLAPPSSMVAALHCVAAGLPALVMVVVVASALKFPEIEGIRAIVSSRLRRMS